MKKLSGTKFRQMLRNGKGGPGCWSRSATHMQRGSVACR